MEQGKSALTRATRSQETALRIIRAAEKVVSQKGPEGATMQLITEEAGQRNTSAAHYHFKNKEGLISAVLSNRMTTINKVRQMMLDDDDYLVPDAYELKFADRVERLIACLIMPIVDEIIHDEDGCYYLRFCERLWGVSANFATFVDPRSYGPYVRVLKLVAQELEMTVRSVTEFRMLMFQQSVVSTLAELELQHSQSSPEVTVARARDLISMFAASLLAPVSPDVVGAGALKVRPRG